MPEKSKPRFVVCAACRADKDSTIFCGPRHFDPTMWSQMFDAGIKYAIGWEQGFIDQHGEWLTRKEAMIVAKEGGQKIDLKGCGGNENVLFSEGLY